MMWHGMQSYEALHTMAVSLALPNVVPTERYVKISHVFVLQQAAVYLGQGCHGLKHSDRLSVGAATSYRAMNQ
jgi:hypothetical protein